jgi:hypothetical protein
METFFALNLNSDKMKTGENGIYILQAQSVCPKVSHTVTHVVP